MVPTTRRSNLFEPRRATTKEDTAYLFSARVSYKRNKYNEMCTSVDGDDVDELFLWTRHCGKWRGISGT